MNHSLRLPGYQILTAIRESADFILLRGLRIQDKRPVVLKILKPDFFTPVNISRFKNEHGIVRDIRSANIVATFGMELDEQNCFLVFEDFELRNTRATGGGISFFRELKDSSMIRGFLAATWPRALQATVRTTLLSSSRREITSISNARDWAGQWDANFPKV